MTEIYNDSFSLMGTNYHQKEALEIMKKLSKKNNYLTMSDEGIKEYILKTYSNVYEYKYLETNDVILVREPKNPHDPNAVKVIAGGLFAGYLPADIAKKVIYADQFEDFDGSTGMDFTYDKWIENKAKLLLNCQRK